MIHFSSKCYSELGNVWLVLLKTGFMFLGTKLVLVLPYSCYLSAKATKCVFLDYSRLHKGYRYYSPDINRYFISVDATFFEDSSFSSAARPPVSNVLSISLILQSLDFPSPPTDVVIRPL